jgi:hypothetical protein
MANPEFSHLKFKEEGYAPRLLLWKRGVGGALDCIARKKIFTWTAYQ